MRRTDRSRRGRPGLRVLALLVVLFPLLGVGPSGASSTVTHQGWTATGPAGPPNADPDNLYVSAIGGQEQARAFVQLDVTDLQEDDVAAAVLGFGPAPDGVMDEEAALDACALATPLTSDGQLTGTAPTVDCTARVPLTRADDGTWELSLTVFADRWATGAPAGVAIIPDTAAGGAVFTVSFDAGKTTLTAPEPQSTTPVTSPPTESEPPAEPPAPTYEAVDGADLALPPPVPTPLALEGSAVAPAERPAATDGVGHLVVDTSPRSAAHPSLLVVLVPAAALAGLALALRSRAVPAGGAATSAPLVGRRSAMAAAWVVVPLVVSTMGETVVYKAGIVAIVFIAAIGLHLLVNWAGELSLAHAGFIGLPAFMVAQFSTHSGLTPILALPVALLTGVVLGSIVGVAALRARGLQVALVTLAVGIAIGQFFFFRTWVVGPPQGLVIPTPSIFGLRLESSRALVPVLTVAVLLAVVAAKSIMGSKVGRAMLQVREDPAAAAAAGVAVARYRALAYAYAGAFAGLAGWTYVVWVQQVTPKAFPLQLGFTYLVIAALAGPGGLAGVAVAALVIQGGALFSILPGRTALYLGPIALIYNVTRYQAGLNGLLAAAGASLRARKGATMRTATGERSSSAGMAPGWRPATVIGGIVVAAGFGAIGLAWYHMGNTDKVWIQNQELVSGGILGLGLVILGSALLVRDAILQAAEIGRPDLPAPPVVGLPEPEPAATHPASGTNGTGTNGTATKRTGSGTTRTRARAAKERL